MFLVTMVTLIISLLWSLQLFVNIGSIIVVIWINLLMIFAWITLAMVFVHKHGCPRKNTSTLLGQLIRT
jgi:hypothetical protein